MQQTKGRWRLRKDAARERLHTCTDAGPQPSRPLLNYLADTYAVHMRNTSPAVSGTWATFLRTRREALKLSQENLGKRVGVDRSTIWRQENRGQRPETFAQAMKMINALGGDRDDAVRLEGLLLAGYADEPDTEVPAEPQMWTYARSLRLDPHDDTVREIIDGPWSDETTREMLREERRMQDQDRQRRLALVRVAKEMYQRGAGGGVDSAAG